MANEDNKQLDYRNRKQTQFDYPQTLKGSFSELQSAFREYTTTHILKDAYTHFEQTVDGQGRPTQVIYYQGTAPAEYKLDYAADVALSLAGLYFSIIVPHSDIEHYFWYQVDGNGVDPLIADAIGHMIPIAENDSALVVSATSKVIILSTGLFLITDYTGLVASTNIMQEQYGVAASLDVATSGFTSTDVSLGSEDIVGQVDMTYDLSGSPIFQGKTLVGYNYDIFKADFVINPVLSLPTGDIGVINNTPFGEYDEVQVTYPSNVVEVFDYLFSAVSLGTVTITYKTGCKKDVLSVVKVAV